MDTQAVTAGDTRRKVRDEATRRGWDVRDLSSVRALPIFDAAASAGVNPSEFFTMKRAFNVQESAAYLGVSVSTIRQLIRDNTLPAKKSGTKVLLDVSALDAYFDALPEVV